MNTHLTPSETVDASSIELLSRITGKNLYEQDVTPPVRFLTALITVLIGVMFADQAVTDEEKQRWQKTINRFIPTEGSIRQLAQLLSKGIREQKIYSQTEALMALSAPFSSSERLLLLGFGYEMACADGSIHERERAYLQWIAKHLDIKPSFLEVFEAGLTHGQNINSSVLEEVRFLLNPARFHELDTLFISAASDLLNMLPGNPAESDTKSHKTISYNHLEKFQNSRKNLEKLCHQLYQIAQEGADRNFLPNILVDDIYKLSQKIQFKKFRVAIIGEFSQGKSTLLNALLGEKIQPVRALPCSGVISVLRYGEVQRVICHYKDGRQEEIPLERYQEMAAIPKEIARGEALSSALIQTEIQELIFEHPGLALCRNGVEIVDSPGLNEHPDRTAITHQLLKEADAVIFLANATRPLPQSEQQLIQELRDQLTEGDPNQPVQNLFVAVNFIDLLEDEEDLQDIRQRFESTLRGHSLLIDVEDRIHYISAKAAFDAVLNGKDNKYLKSFLRLTRAIEQFLANERWALEVKWFEKENKLIIHEISNNLNLAKELLLNSETRLSDQEKKNILERFGELAGRDIKIRILADQLLDSVLEKVDESWSQWIDQLAERLAERVDKWSSQHSILWSRDQLISDYASQFNKDLSEELNRWMEDNLIEGILDPCMKLLDQKTKETIEEIESVIDENDGLIESSSFDWIFHDGKYLDPGNQNILGGLGLAGLGVAAFVPVFILASPILAVIGGLAAGGLIGTGVGSLLEFDTQVRAKVFEKGCEQFVDSLEKTNEKIGEIIVSEFQTRLEQIDRIISKAISVYDALLEKQEKVGLLTLEQRDQEMGWILRKQTELKYISQQMQSAIEKLS